MDDQSVPTVESPAEAAERARHAARIEEMLRAGARLPQVKISKGLGPPKFPKER